MGAVSGGWSGSVVEPNHLTGVSCANMWKVVYKRPDGGDEVAHWKGSEADARQDFAERVQEVPAKGYEYVLLTRDDVTVRSWPS
jgi:hypothetical protein